MSHASTTLITGAAGFIGSHLAYRLIGDGQRVIGVDNFDPFYSRESKSGNLAAIELVANRNNFSFVEADIRDRETMSTLVDKHCPGMIVHLAALAGVRPSVERPDRFADVNVNGLVSMLDAARAGGCKKFLFASSSSVYGNNSKVPFAETDPVDAPISPYAATKRAGELICHTYSHLYDLSIACLRFFTVYGPRQRPDLAISKFMQLLANDRPIPMFGDGSTSRDYTYVDDIIDGIVAASKQTENAQYRGYRIWNLGGSSPISLNDMIQAISEVVGRKPRIHQQPMQPGDVQQTFADTTRIERELDYKPKTLFHDGLARQWEAMLSDHTIRSTR